LDAIRALKPDVTTTGIEINAYSQSIAASKGHKVQLGSVLEAEGGDMVDLVFTRGVLIHINPESLPNVYGFMHRKSKRYILIDEYFNPTPVSMPYRGHQDRLFKRDFAKEIMNNFNLRLIDYGFTWKEDPVFPLDNLNWFLFEKRS
jgi:spore coat polysaccharide biosynthesis protein SpsF